MELHKDYTQGVDEECCTAPEHHTYNIFLVPTSELIINIRITKQLIHRICNEVTITTHAMRHVFRGWIGVLNTSLFIH
jgi:hypothetical protein